MVTDVSQARDKIRMHRSNAPARTQTHPSERDSESNPWRWLTRTAFVLALALVLCRAMMSDAIRTGGDASAGALAAPLAPGPGTSLAIDLLCCIPALLVLARHAFDKSFTLTRSWVYIPMFLLAAWAAASVIWAADRFAAVVSASHLVCALVLLWSVSQLVRSWLRIRLVAAAGVALLLVLIASGYYYRLSEFRDLKETWDQHKSEILKERGLKPGSYEAQQFEKRIVAGQPMGFSTSTNTYAALLVLLGVVSAGVVIQRLADRDHPGWLVLPALGALLIFPLIRWTLCRAAYATPVLSAMLLVAIYFLRPWLKRLARPLFVLGALLITGATFVVVHHGLRHGTLWHDSLNFRWNYWVGSYRVLTQDLPHHRFEQFLIGVGWENFGPQYLAHRLPVAAEEIKDPHNFIVRVFVELGMIGGVLLIAWMLKLWWDLTSSEVPAAEIEPSSYPGNGQRLATLTVISIGVTAIIVNVFASIDFTAEGAFVFLELVRRGVFLLLIIVGLTAAGVRTPPGRDEDAAPGELDFELDDRPAPWILYALLVGLATFLIHNLIEFSLFETGPMFVFALLTGSALGLRLGAKSSKTTSEPAPQSRGLAIGSLSLAGLLWIALVVAVFIPIASAEGMAHDADDAARGRRFQDAAQEMKSAFHRVPYNADYASRAAMDLAQAGAPARDIKKMLDAAVAADASSVQALVVRAQFELSGEGKNPDAALRDFRRALALDPRNVRLRIQYADALRGFAAELHRPTLAGEALLEYHRALDMNEQYNPDEPKRLSREEIAQVKSAMSALEPARRAAPADPLPPATGRRDRGQ